jgi:hypothetical protein
MFTVADAGTDARTTACADARATAFADASTDNCKLTRVTYYQ